jgi:hypothetical protein
MENQKACHVQAFSFIYSPSPPEELETNRRPPVVNIWPIVIGAEIVRMVIVRTVIVRTVIVRTIIVAPIGIPHPIVPLHVPAPGA